MRKVHQGVPLIIGSVALLGLLSACHRTPPTTAEAIGVLAVQLPESAASGKGASIEIPDATITLINAQNAEVARGTTNLAGQFRVKAPITGTYQLCWDIQGSQGCRADVALTERQNFLATVAIRIKEAALYGRVLTGDNRACWVNDPFFKLNVATQVSVTDSTGNAAAQPVRANIHGDYLFPMRSSGAFTVLAQCEAAAVKASVTLQNAIARADMNLGNHAPRLMDMAARSASKGIVRSAPGASVELAVNAKDRDGDAIEYLWRDADGQSAAPATDNRLVRNAPDSAQRQTTYVMLRDGRGGYTYQRFDLEVGDASVQFSGTVLDEVTHAPVANAAVELGGTTVTTNAQGWFSVSGPTNSTDRYVVNVRHADYALLSRVFDRSARANVFELIRAQVRSVPAGAPLDLSDTDSSGPCGTGKDGITAAGNKLTVVNKAKTMEYVDAEPSSKYKPLDADLLRKLTAPRQCQHLGATIRIPAGALVDSNGQAPAGAIRAAMATHDPTRRALPGDARAIDSSSREAELLSYGAVYAEFRDAANQKLNLKPGTTADIIIPVPVQQRSSAKPSIDFWSYNEVTGKWQYEGKANLQNTASGPAYVGKTKHFSYLNMDVAGSDPANATCLRFTLDPAFSSWSNLRVRATVSYNGNAVITKETSVDSQQYHAIYRIPFGTAFPPNTVRLELFGEFGGQSVALVDNVINTDLRPQMTYTPGDPNALWPPYPYDQCGVPITLAPATGVVPEYLSNDATNRPYFLTGPYGAFLPEDGDTLASNYYAALGVDPTTYKLSQWWSDNGFDASGNGTTTPSTQYARAAYLNHNDLGFGRDMHCFKKSNNNVGCYVTNYGAPNQEPANADAALNQTAAQRGATVAMTFTSGGGAQAVQFYVFTNKGTDPSDPFGSATMLKFADLDGFGPKPVPHLCLVCHGGEFNSGNNKADHARFREFDLPSFRFPAGASWNYGAAVPATVDMPAFGSLNQMARSATPSTAPIYGLISAWYPTNNFALAPVLPTPPGNSATPGDWANAANVSGYHQVYGTTCRTCHVARDSGLPTPPSIVFNTKAIFATKSFAVCGKDYRVMPNAIITYKNFWLDTSRVAQYEIINSVPAGHCALDTP